MNININEHKRKIKGENQSNSLFNCVWVPSSHLLNNFYYFILEYPFIVAWDTAPIRKLRPLYNEKYLRTQRFLQTNIKQCSSLNWNNGHELCPIFCVYRCKAWTGHFAKFWEESKQIIVGVLFVLVLLCLKVI